MDQAQVAYWGQFWKQAGSIRIDQKSLMRKLGKQAGLILKHLDLTGKRILDIGCGFGFVDRYLLERADCTISGVDFQAHEIQRSGYGNGQLNFVSADYLALPFQRETFDMVLAIETLHHLNRYDIPGALDQACRVLKKDGDLVLIEVNRFHPLILALTIFDPSERNQFFLSISRLASILETRFAKVEIYPLNHFLPTYKYKPPPLVDSFRNMIYFLEDLTERKYFCTEYLVIARQYRPMTEVS